ncbi:MAG: penicillin amidase [Acidobacteriota bacterium]|nr:penicillin amidase [Acidobacteriota bacterium]
MKRRSALLCAAIIYSCLTPFHSVQAQTPNVPNAQPSTRQLAGLRSTVTIRRDERGIAYIDAGNDADLFFAQGYVTASDRLFQMDLLRRTARGELAEMFGAGPDGAVLEGDKQHRRYGFAQLADSQLARMPVGLRDALEDYARGVNAYIQSLDAKELPPEFQILQMKPRPWRAADSLVIGKLLDETLSTSWQADISRAAFADLPTELQDQLFPQTSPLDVILVGSDKARKKTAAGEHSYPRVRDPRANPDELAALSSNVQMTRETLERVGLFAQDFAASNNWVISGKLSTTGKPLLANDPHLSASAPSIWYMVHLSGPNLRSAGVAVPGIPGIGIGHNEQIAWGVTSLEPDVQDLYVEKFDPQNPLRYMTPTGWRDVEVRHEQILVRKSLTSTTTEPTPFDVISTRHGPIIFEKNSKRYALRWTALDPDANIGPSFFLLNIARNWNDFRAALRNYSGPAFNMIYADVKGHIGYYGAGRFPIRRTGKGTMPYDGATTDGDWTGFIPFEALPHVYDPPDGIILTANTRIVGFDYPYYLSVIPGPAYRARRIYDLLHAKKSFSIDDFRAIQGDTYSISGALFAREVVEMAREEVTTAKDERWQAAVSLLSEWDGRVVPESRAALLAAHMRDGFRRRVLTGVLGADRARSYSFSNAHTLIDRLIEERPRQWLPKEFASYVELLHSCFNDAHAELTKSQGADESKWAWGRESMARFPHPLAGVPLIGQQFAIAPFPQKGSQSSFPTVNRGSNVSMRLIADTSDWDRTQQGIALGVSGLPLSPHWKDQLDDWRNVTPRVFPFSKAAVARAARETLILTPATK